ncbi:hypothetical protein SCD6.10 [Leishmania braziliensis MHOM/BR/75/M2904]|uniref:Scd6-like Sm domain containing protein n=2 Tax=Leishmania braziliensis TaxID=5660 RepID=A4HEG4_LEIBR|nr:hypothetical protein SCD6.10 [Leishmania braziliensis MHOM/BR/75/M2904]KAI5690224.1 Scd6like Sm domain containing protein [Leishmania braziliensis]CAJ2474040.1 unnamed protein product [Leishmania braziliensis]CAJ2474553.1 unnamed protein product [Leishmania braziliensis]CAM39220.1 hypothetical protein SCD6.10 [Leishmania braziliensis MHOM/BR/75/M2904]SYZ66461.1 Scd6-like_Sm_domain_containing_protein [Leishmania braziliensis MHOM/BR/75/M2904]
MHNAVGDRINLISKSEIRYEGHLHSINTDENTVSLSNVRIYGTEGRKGGGVDEVPSTEQLFEFIVFRGSDIKDLTVFRDGGSPQARDPAIVEVHAPSRGRGGRAAAAAAPAGASGATSSAAARGSRSFYDEHSSYSRGGGGARRGGYGAGRYSHNNGGGNSSGNRNHRGGYGGRGGSGSYRRNYRDCHTGQDFKPSDIGATEKFEGDFDFAKCREEFEKKKSEFEKAKEDAKTHAKAYDKSSFFDTISCDQKEKNNMNRAEMRKADTETFGSEMVSSMRGFRRGRGGRGRYQQR